MLPTMSWAKLDDRFYNHPKMRTLNASAGWLWARALSYAAAYETDGLLSKGALRTISARKRDRDRLVAAGLWEDLGDGVCFIHDFLDYNPSRAELDEKRAATRERVARSRQDRAQNAPETRQDSARSAPDSRQIRASAAAGTGADEDPSEQVNGQTDSDVTALHDGCNTTPGPTRPGPTRPDPNSRANAAAPPPLARTGEQQQQRRKDNEEEEEERLTWKGPTIRRPEPQTIAQGLAEWMRQVSDEEPIA